MTNSCGPGMNSSDPKMTALALKRSSDSKMTNSLGLAINRRDPKMTNSPGLEMNSLDTKMTNSLGSEMNS